MTRTNKNEWIEQEVSIGDIEQLLKEHEIEVTSPDGYVPVSEFIDKGEWDEYALASDEFDPIYCNENHLFQTDIYDRDPDGWCPAIELVGTVFKVLTEDGWKTATVIPTGRKVPIVDIQVDHENHRYYTQGVSSHNTGVGKSITLCHFAANYLNLGKNVLYITLEMSEERIAQRIDANLMDIPIQNLEMIPEQQFMKGIDKLKAKTKGQLVVKEFPTGSAHVGHFRALLNELSLKKDITFDVICIDYLNICASARFKGSADSSYALVKAIAEEVRGLAVEFNVPIWTATQSNREGNETSDPTLSNVSESIGLPQTCDLFLAMFTNENLENMGQVMFKQLKNRYNDVSAHKRFVLGLDKPKMRLYDVDDSAQQGITGGGAAAGNAAPVADQPFGESVGEAANWDSFKF